MSKENEKIKELLTRYVTGSINRLEMDTLLDYLVKNPQDTEVDEFLRMLLEDIDLEKENSLDSEDLYQRITKDVRFQRSTRQTSFLKFYWASHVAAGILLFMFVFLYKIDFWGGNEKQLTLSSLRIDTPINIDSELSPLLRLADGTLINLDSAASGLLLSHENLQIILKGPELQYKGLISKEMDSDATNTIITPRGRQYHLVLADGTKIWLNAGTSLTYPVQFQEGARVVEVHGEAYFEVEKAKSWPFYVKTFHQQIEVLGTHFNVSAYEDDLFSKTTLVEGSLQVSTNQKNTSTLWPLPFLSKSKTVLVPGEQALMNHKENKIRVEKVDPEEIISWRKNLFVFHNEEIKEVMKKVSRWYDIDIIYQDGMEGKRIGGAIPRFEEVEKLMDVLKETGLLNYKMKGGSIVIMK